MVCLPPLFTDKMAADVTSSPIAAVSSFILSPPLTRAKSRRISITPAPSPSAIRGIGLLSTVYVRGMTTLTAPSPAKKASRSLEHQCTPSFTLLRHIIKCKEPIVEK